MPYVKKSLMNFNKINEPNEKDFDRLSISIIKDLGYRKTENNVENLSDHLNFEHMQQERFLKTMQIYDILNVSE